MQISSQEVRKIQTTVQQPEKRAQAPVESVEDLAAKHGVKMDEVRRFTERVMMSDEDIARERRVQELAKRVAAGTYRVEAEQVVDMAERRAIADLSKNL